MLLTVVVLRDAELAGTEMVNVSIAATSTATLNSPSKQNLKALLRSYVKLLIQCL